MSGVTLPGPVAAKVGLRYEDAWAAHCALRMLGGEAEWMDLERAGTEAEGFEFSLKAAGVIEHHQVKRQHGGDGSWDLQDLNRGGVLGAFRQALDEPGAVCVFASGNAAQALDELAGPAADADSFDHFERAVLHYKTRRNLFGELREIWGTDDQSTFDAVRRIRIETIGEPRLNGLVALQCEVLLEGPVATAPGEVIKILRARVGQRVYVGTLWADLQRAGFTPNPWRFEHALGARILEANEHYLRSRRQTLITNKLIPRLETQKLGAALDDHDVVLVQGTAGFGKSDVLFELTQQLETQDIAYMALRLDRWNSTSSSRDLGQQIGLPVSPPAALAQLCPDRKCVLIIDQLDAMSSASGRNTEFFECVEDMLSLAGASPHISVVLACRQFDATHDGRLRRLIGDAHTITVGQLTDEQVTQPLAELGIDQRVISTELQALLRVPLHLSLFTQISPVDPADLPDLLALGDLYRRYWERKQEDLKRELGREPRWTQVLDLLLQYMSERAILQAPTELLDDHEADRKAMLSASVLVEDGGRVAFFHETFFDYAFARRFFAQGHTIQELLATDQLLFRRAQVRQLLVYERDRDRDRYLQDLCYLLLDPGVRFHIRDVVIAWLSGLEEPADDEWDLLAKLLEDSPDPVKRRVEGTITSPGWFVLLDRRGLIEQWLANPARKDVALRIAAAGQAADGNRSAELLAAHGQRSPDGAADVADILGRMHLAGSRPTFDLLLDLLASDDQTLENGDFLLVAHDLPDEHPDWGCELVGAYLANRLRAADREQITNPFGFSSTVIPRHLYIRKLVVDSAKAAPEAFIKHVLPQMLALIERTAQPQHADESEPVHDEIWHGAWAGDRHGDQLDDDLLEAAEAALRAHAAADRDQFLVLVETNRDTEFETVCALLYEGFHGAPEELADAAMDFVLADLRRLRVGRASEDHWATRELLRAVTPYCSEDGFEALEAVVLGHYTPWEKSAAGRKARGYSQFTLLDGMAADRLSGNARRRLGEWQRKFERQTPYPPMGVTSGFVASPIGSSQTEKMSDADWLRAIERYSSDHSDPREPLKGGAHQLSQELQKCAKADPVRFCDLAEQIPDAAHLYYFDALLRGVGESEQDVPLDSARALVLRCHRLPDRPCGRWIGQPLRRYADDGPLPEDLVGILCWYAENDPDPPPASDDFRGNIPDLQRMEMQGLNSVRGSIASEIARHVFRHEDNIDAFAGAITTLVSDASAPVRSMTVDILSAMLGYRPQQAVELFARLADHPDERLLAGRVAHPFLRWAGGRYLDQLKPIIDRMIGSDHDEVRVRGAAQAALAALANPAAEDLVQRCLTGGPGLRKGVVRVLAANVRDASYRDLCAHHLIALFDDPDPDVRAAAAEVFIAAGREGFDGINGLVEAFIISRSFDADGAEKLLHGLEMATSAPSDLVLQACTAYIQSDFTGARSHGRGMALRNAGDLVLRAYASARTREAREAALDVIDQLLMLGTYRLGSSLVNYER